MIKTMIVYITLHKILLKEEISKQMERDILRDSELILLQNFSR